MTKTYKVTRTQTVTVQATDADNALDTATDFFYGTVNPRIVSEDWTIKEVSA